MSTSFELPEVDRLTTGAIGPPGQRVFYLQARHRSAVVTLRLEKTQVAALVQYVNRVLAGLPPPDDLPGDMELEEPVIPEWVVGTLSVSYDEDADQFVMVAEELVEEGEPAARASITVSREQAAALALHGAAVVAAGRPPCPLCGQPLEPEGHVCARLNGHKRPTP